VPDELTRTETENQLPSTHYAGNIPAVPGIAGTTLRGQRNPGKVAGTRTYTGTVAQRQQAAQKQQLQNFLNDESVPANVRGYVRAQFAAGDTSLPAELFSTKPDTRSLQLRANDAQSTRSALVTRRVQPIYGR
jgi:hypothetical protein